MKKMDQFISKTLDVIEKLKDPYLVARFQNYFGVYRLDFLKNGECSVNGSTCVNERTSTFLTNSTKDCDNAHLRVPNGIINGINLRMKCSYEDNELKNKSPATSDAEELLSDVDSDGEVQSKCRIDNKFWYYFFSFGAGLGYEMFYASFFPFWFWNIDGAVCRRVVMLWVLIMYIGQALKDVIRWPRPAAPPVVQLEPGYTQEYGMPSTHAMVGAAVPFSLLFFTMHRYEYPFVVGLLLASAWCVLVCCSRLYMGMHTILDIIGGLILVAILMVIFIPVMDTFDNFQLTSSYGPFVTSVIMVVLAVFYPESDRWTPARGDTTTILGTGAGISIGSWLNFQMGIIRGPKIPPPYQILWPDYGVIGLALLRASIGILCVVATRAFFKSLTYAILCYLLRLDPQDLKNRQKVSVDIPHKFISYVFIGLMVTYIAPIVFRLLNIERVTMFTEV